ncbi:MAG: 4Fe-4S dicluster domain-containing protein, partial [Candidatus Methanomethylophilaceae archaeon]|nr:4Fe-4S dicluster domain-containing protein [Candidatus Methanomethylophilaceae archaeon]
MVTPNPDFVSELAAAGGENAKMCFQCGTCTAGCPSGKNTAYRTRKLMRMAQLGLK